MISTLNRQLGLPCGVTGDGKQTGQGWGAARPHNQPDHGNAAPTKHQICDIGADGAADDVINFDFRNSTQQERAFLTEQG
jgi:hypothetical protein